MNQKIIIRAGGVNEHFNLPWIKLSERNNFPNIEFNWNHFAGGTGVLTTALRENQIDIAVLLTEGLLLDILKNNDFKLVAFHVKNPLRWGIHVRENDFTQSVNYSNKKFAVSRMGSGSHTMAKYLLSENNTIYDEKMMIEVGSLEGGIKAIANQTADVFLWEKFTTEPFLNENKLKCIGEVLTPWPPFSVAVKKSFYNENKKVISDILAEIREISNEILLSKDTLREIEQRWNIQTENAAKWLSEIKWEDQLLAEDFDFTPIFDNMKKASLLHTTTAPVNPPI